MKLLLSCRLRTSHTDTSTMFPRPALLRMIYLPMVCPLLIQVTMAAFPTDGDWGKFAEDLAESIGESPRIKRGQTDQLATLELNPMAAFFGQSPGSESTQDVRLMTPAPHSSTGRDGHPTQPNKRRKSIQAPSNLSAFGPVQEHEEHHEVSPSHFDSGFWKHVQLCSPDQLDSAFKKILRPDRPTSRTSILSDKNFLTLELKSFLDEIQNKKHGPLADQHKKHYENTINEIYAKFDDSSLLPEMSKISNWPITTTTSFNDESGYYVSLIIPVNDQGERYDPDILLKVFADLNDLLAHIHYLIWNHLNRNVPGHDDHHQDYQKLVLWLFGEVFNPKKSIPVLGETSLNGVHDGEFGAIQIWILKLLQDPTSLLKVSLVIAGTWFKETCPKWTESFKIDDYFWARIPILLERYLAALRSGSGDGSSSRSLNSESSIQQSGKNSNDRKYKHILPKPVRTQQDPNIKKINQVFEIGNFALFDIILESQKKIRNKNRLLTWMSDTVCPKVPTAKEDVSISILESFYPRLREMPSGSQVHQQTSHPRMVLTNHRAEENKFGVRLLSADLTKFVDGSNWKIGLHHFVNSLECYSSLILGKIFSNRQEWPEGINHTSFLEWFYRKLYGPNQSSIIPIIGTIPKSIFHTHNQTQLKFDEAQTLIINSLCKTNNHFKYHEASLILLAYWLKNEHPILWNQQFTCDLDYSKFIMDVVTKYKDI
ncbi:hypothetical protein PGTUg99_019835 [Puccinia graminis f. sp. tritici]|uniref:Uncharacterized protein n=2 Tax=Puccinia graminis f. sp. tritici TaxID=56615 RepID=A0A5B0R6F0_PUCGR|nr:hypothetical protein PGTUg99_019835 [Puccinia graminis f. sp. tritici]